MSRGGTSNQYIRVLQSSKQRWLGAANGGTPAYIGDAGCLVQCISGGGFGVEGSDSVIFWSPRKHENVFAYDIQKSGDVDPTGSYSLSGVTSVSLLYKTALQQEAIDNSCGFSPTMPITVVVKVSGVSGVTNGWYMLETAQIQGGTTSVSTITFPNIFAAAHANNKWYSISEQATAVGNTYGRIGVFRSERFWSGGLVETTPQYSITGPAGSIDAIGFIIIGNNGASKTCYGNPQDTDGSAILDEIRVY
jgi:hypothetical protein